MELEILVEENYNQDFYSDCRAYFAALQKQGLTDDGFEDEYYFTMPGISGNT